MALCSQTFTSWGARLMNTIPERLKELMAAQGFIHESDVEELSSTTESSRRRWKLPYVKFGNQRYYTIDGLKSHLDSKVSAPDEFQPISLT